MSLDDILNEEKEASGKTRSKRGPKTNEKDTGKSNLLVQNFTSR